MGRVYFFLLLASFFCSSVVFGQTFFQENFNENLMPPTGWTTEGNNAHWEMNNSKLAGGEAPEGRFNWSPSENSTFRLISPTIDLAGYSVVGVTFKHFIDHYSSTIQVGVDVRTDGGDWTNLWEITPESNVGPEVVLFGISDQVGSANVQLSWYYKGTTDNIDYWYLDDIELFVPTIKDAAVSSIILPTQVDPQTQITPEAVISTLGLGGTFEVKCEIFLNDQMLYESVKTLSNVSAVSMTQVVFDSFTPTQSDELFKVVVTTMWGDDSNSENDETTTHFTSNTSDRVVLWEQFTNSSCGYCAPFNVELTPALNNLGYASVIPINYHVWWPGENDPFYQANTVDPRSRTTDYYGVSGVPAPFCDGSSYGAGSSTEEIENYVMARKAIKTGVEIIPIVSLLGEHAVFHVQVNATGGIIPGIYKLHCVVIESGFQYTTPPGSNGETEFDWVMRRMYPGATGTTINISKGETLNISVEANLERIWRKPNIAYLVFVQNDETKEIIQAAVTTTVTDIEDIKELPLTFGLAQNYPNPFNPSTVIKYQIPESSIVSLKVFDMLGREIKVLVNEQKNAGEYSVELDASQYSSGVYFYELRCNNFVNSRKMLLMK